MHDIEKVIKGLRDIDGFIAGRVRFEQAKNFMQTIDEAVVLLKEKETVEHACDILRANGWKETEPLCSECNAVHVVLCKDCKHRSEEILDKKMIWCNLHKFARLEDHYCADGA